MARGILGTTLPRTDFRRRCSPRSSTPPTSSSRVSASKSSTPATPTPRTPPTSLWVPALRLIVAGDVVYNDTHPFTTESTTESREHWAQANERLAELDPVAVVAGHKKPDLPDDPITMAETAAYLRDFNRIEAQTSTALDLYNQMLELYPRRANPGSLWGGAKFAKSA